MILGMSYTKYFINRFFIGFSAFFLLGKPIDILIAPFFVKLIPIVGYTDTQLSELPFLQHVLVIPFIFFIYVAVPLAIAVLIAKIFPSRFMTNVRDFAGLLFLLFPILNIIVGVVIMTWWKTHELPFEWLRNFFSLLPVITGGISIIIAAIGQYGHIGFEWLSTRSERFRLGLVYVIVFISTVFWNFLIDLTFSYHPNNCLSRCFIRPIHVEEKLVNSYPWAVALESAWRTGSSGNADAVFVFLFVLSIPIAVYTIGSLGPFHSPKALIQKKNSKSRRVSK